VTGARIGLEVHAYVATRAKLFCPCDADFLRAPRANANVCPTCVGEPGAKPMAPNRAAIEAAIALGRVFGSRERPDATFLRKHYFYPDLASNYQRTSTPIVEGGSLLGVRLREIHVEEDPGAYDLATGLVDYNRSGAPLLEIVTEPDVASPAQARAFLEELRFVLSALDLGRTAAGVKADCNVSVAGGERAEVKNVNSPRNVERAVAYEVERQLEAVARGEKQARETRQFDEATGRTSRLRAKESEADYRYFADPDLGPIDVAALSRALAPAESPLARRARLAEAAGVPEVEVAPILEERALADAFEGAAARAGWRPAYDFFIRDLRAELGFRGIPFAAARVTAEDAAALVEALAARRVTPQVATRLLREGLDRGGLAAALAAEAGAIVVGDALAEAARAAVRDNPKAVADVRAGRAAAVNFLVGQAMRALKGRGDPGAVRAAVERALEDAS